MREVTFTVETFRMRFIPLLYLLCFISISAHSQGKILESLQMKSKLLNTQINYSVYLPENYEASNSTYPVVYLLNGFEGDETSWIHDGNLEQTMNELIENYAIIPMIIIMPDGDDRLYMNKDDGTYPYEDMFMSEFIPFIESSYRIKSEKKFRSISGLSMGGSGSLRWSFLYPNLFGTCAAFSPGISTTEEIINEASESFDYYFGQISPSIVGKKGKARLTKTMTDYDVLQLVETINTKLLKTINIYIDCGDNDMFRSGSAKLHLSLSKKKIDHEYHVRDGIHDWEFWKDSLPEGLKFISSVMQSN